MKTVSEIYVSTDIEADGPIPGPNSMLSLGSAAYTGEGKLLDTFGVNLLTLDGAKADLDTARWWASQPEAWAACRVDATAPEVAMQRYVAWLNGLPGKPVFVGYPATYDWLFTYWYMMKFTGESPFGISGLDIKSYAAALLDTPFKETTKKRMPPNWFSGSPHTHKAVDDAVEQGELFCNMMKYRKTHDKCFIREETK